MSAMVPGPDGRPGGRAMIDTHHAVLAAVEKKDADAAGRAIIAGITEVET